MNTNNLRMESSGPHIHEVSLGIAFSLMVFGFVIGKLVIFGDFWVWTLFEFFNEILLLKCATVFEFLVTGFFYIVVLGVFVVDFCCCWP